MRRDECNDQRIGFGMRDALRAEGMYATLRPKGFALGTHELGIWLLGGCGHSIPLHWR
jgi:hypothetical protein